MFYQIWSFLIRTCFGFSSSISAKVCLEQVVRFRPGRNSQYNDQRIYWTMNLTTKMSIVEDEIRASWWEERMVMNDEKKTTTRICRSLRPVQLVKQSMARVKTPTARWQLSAESCNNLLFAGKAGAKIFFLLLWVLKLLSFSKVLEMPSPNFTFGILFHN